MKRIALALAASLGLAAAAAADPIEGVWQTEVDDGAFAYVAVAPCGAAYCGTITRTFDTDGEYRSPNIGRQIVREMEPRGGGAYEGRVWRPSNDKVYLGKIQLEGDRMALRGCVAGGLFCARQTWVKVQ
jgi:uncharacterized protein (DUF2147 family)